MTSDGGKQEHTRFKRNNNIALCYSYMHIALCIYPNYGDGSKVHALIKILCMPYFTSDSQLHLTACSVSFSLLIVPTHAVSVFFFFSISCIVELSKATDDR